jgi:outer membrane protein assembly factor BamB
LETKQLSLLVALKLLGARVDDPSDDNGLLTFDARTGDRAYQQRVGGGTSAFTGSPVAADGKIYIMSEEGDVFVVKAGRTYELLATNPLGEIGMATPAISEGVIYIRTGRSLVAIGG